MKNYEEVTKSVMERSNEIIAKKSRRHRIMMTAVSTSATCLVIAGALGFGAWISSRQDNDVVLSANSDLPPFSADTTVTASDEHIYDTTAAVENGLNDPSDTTAANIEPAETNKQHEIEGNPPIRLHDHDYIRSEKTVKDSFETPPKNGTVYISSELQNALDTIGDSYEDGCKAPYFVRFDYYKDGELIVPTEDLFNSERARLQELIDYCNENDEYTQPCTFGFGWSSSDWEVTKEYSLSATLYKAQMDICPPNEDYAIVINLDDSFSATFYVGEIVESDPQPSQTPTRAPSSHYSYKAGDSYTLEAPAENGQVRIAEALTDAIDHYGRYYCDGVENQFCVVIEYYNNGQRINPDTEFFEKEKTRLTELCGTDDFMHSPATEEIELRDYDFLWADLTVSQMNKITVDETFGCVIYLIGDYQRSY